MAASATVSADSVLCTQQLPPVEKRGGGTLFQNGRRFRTSKIQQFATASSICFVSILFSMAVIFQIFLAKHLMLSAPLLTWLKSSMEDSDVITRQSWSRDSGLNTAHAAFLDAPQSPDYAGIGVNAEVFSNYSLYPPTLYKPRTTYCFYHHRPLHALNNGSVQKMFTIFKFPYHLCSDAVFCCVSLVSVSPVQIGRLEKQALSFYLLAKINKKLRVHLMINDDINGVFLISQQRKGAQIKFSSELLSVVKRARFDGILFKWKEPPSVNEDQSTDHVEVMKTFKQIAVSQRMSVGVVVSSEDSLDWKPTSVDIVGLSGALEPNSVIIEPPHPLQNKAAMKSYFQRFVIYSEATIELYRRLFSRVAPHLVCFPVSICGTSFKTMGYRQARNMIRNQAKSKEAGRLWPGTLAYYQTCGKEYQVSGRLGTPLAINYGVLTRSSASWMWFLNELALSRLMRRLVDVARSSWPQAVNVCSGIWDVAYDDFEGSCSLIPFPLTRLVFERDHLLE